MWTQEELDYVVGVAPRLFLVICNVKDLRATYQCYEEFPMGVNLTVRNF